MGTRDKRNRRAENRVFQDYTIAIGNNRYPMKDSRSAKEMVREFASPLAPFVDEERSLYSVAIFAWNISMLPAERHDELIDEFIAPLAERGTEGSAHLKEVIRALIERRLKAYPREEVAFLPNPPRDLSIGGA
ncbi:MAG TPA: hypothetical protein VMV68_00050 [Spirochaetia bacterium]|nr:hypothetical protein [Spirochaetia bacterium]